MQKVEQKNQGKPEPLRAFCHPRTVTLRFIFIIHVHTTKQQKFLSTKLFQKLIVEYSQRVTNESWIAL